MVFRGSDGGLVLGETSVLVVLRSAHFREPSDHGSAATDRHIALLSSLRGGVRRAETGSLARARHGDVAADSEFFGMSVDEFDAALARLGASWISKS